MTFLRLHAIRKRCPNNSRKIKFDTASLVRAVYGSLHTLNYESSDIACSIADNIIFNAQRSCDSLDLIGQSLRTKDSRVRRLRCRHSVKGNEYIVTLIRIVQRIGEQQNRFDVVEAPGVVRLKEVKGVVDDVGTLGVPCDADFDVRADLNLRLDDGYE